MRRRGERGDEEEKGQGWGVREERQTLKFFYSLSVRRKIYIRIPRCK